jgi:demethylmenaquinone methyltransferase/2-methoxy-6-polyprenyl-1,4-benzoquinol methylase
MGARELLDGMRRYYRDRASHHDGYMGYTSNEAMEELLRDVIRLVEPQVAGRDVLEVACGTGNWTQVLSRRARSVVAVDLFEDYLRLARAKPYPRGNVEFRLADAYSLEGVGGPFDAAFCADWWSHMPRSVVATFLRAMHGVLAPGARVAVVDMLRTAYFDSIRSHLDEEGNEVQRRALPDGREYLVVKNFPSESELRSALGDTAADLRYVEDAALGRWVLTYTLAGTP